MARLAIKKGVFILRCNFRLFLLRLPAYPCLSFCRRDVEFRPHISILKDQMYRSFHEEPDVEKLAFGLTVETLPNTPPKNVEFPAHGIMDGAARLKIHPGQHAQHAVNVVVNVDL